MCAAIGSYAALSSIRPPLVAGHGYIDHHYRLVVYHASVLEPDPALLGERERAWMAAHELAPARRDEWMRGRVALRRVLPVPTEVLADADGAPVVVQHGWVVSLSHEGEWFAVACRPQASPSSAVAVDLVLETEHERACRALTRLSVARGASVEPLPAWAALECALKLRRRGIFTLLGSDADVRVEREGELLRVEGVGAAVACRVHRLPPVVVAVGTEDGA